MEEVNRLKNVAKDLNMQLVEINNIIINGQEPEKKMEKIIKLLNDGAFFHKIVDVNSENQTILHFMSTVSEKNIKDCDNIKSFTKIAITTAAGIPMKQIVENTKNLFKFLNENYDKIRNDVFKLNIFMVLIGQEIDENKCEISSDFKAFLEKIRKDNNDNNDNNGTIISKYTGGKTNKNHPRRTNKKHPEQMRKKKSRKHRKNKK
jgi:hypothetical protein